ncbi:MAG: efflux RND transporter permease subunit [Acidobacteriota bacterium]
MKGLIGFSIKRPVTVSMIFLAIILFGFVSLRELSVDLLPDIRYPKLTVRTTYRGAAPEEIESFITAPLEAMLNTIPGIKNIESVSKEGLSVITLEFAWGTDMDFALLHTREKLDSARYFLPQDAGRPTIIQYDPQSRPIMTLALSGSKTTSIVELNSFAVEMLKPRLEQIYGVAEAEISGGVEREIYVDIDPKLLELYKLDISEVASKIDAFNASLQGGFIKKGRFKYAFRVKGELESVKDIESIPLKRTEEGGLIRLGDISRTYESIKEREGVVRLNGAECLGVLLFKEAQANTVKVTKEIRQVLAEIKKENPGTDLEVIQQDSKLIEDSVSSLTQSILIGALLVFFVLVFFLQNFKDSIIIAVAIPIAVISTFNLMYFRNITLNIMSLGGLALGIGMFVENSIVVVESIYRRKVEGMGAEDASYYGTKEVAMAIVAAIFTTIAVFFPVVYVHGVAGQLFRDQSLTVTFSLLASLFVALMLLPMLTSREVKIKEIGIIEKKEEKKERKFFRAFISLIKKIISFVFDFILSSIFQAIQFIWKLITKILRPFFNFGFRVFNSGYSKFYSVYHRFLEWSLDNKGKVLLVMALILALTFFIGINLKRELMPRPKTSYFEVEIRTPVQFSFEETQEIFSRIEKDILENESMEFVFSQVGIIGGAESLRYDVSINSGKLVGKTKSYHELPEVLSFVRDILKKYPQISYSIREEESVMTEFLQFAGTGIQLKIFGDDLDKLKGISQELMNNMENVRGITDLNTNIGEGKPEILVKMNYSSLQKFGISPAELGNYLVNSVRGKDATQFKEFDKKIDVVVRFDPEYRERIETLMNQQAAFKGNLIPLRDLVYYEIIQGPDEIRRENQQRELILKANLSGEKLSKVIPEIEREIRRIGLPSGYRVVIGGEREEASKSFKSLQMAFLLASILVFMILASQFESLFHPFIIVLTIPMGLVGVILGLFITNQSINVMAVIGTIVMAGVVVNDAIVKVDYMNYLRKNGLSPRSAILKASEVKVRPVVMNTITDVFGVLPTAIGLGAGSELQQPLAIAFIGGLTVATILTIILIPVIYEILEKRKDKK